MRRVLMMGLQAVIVLIGVAAAAILLWEPQIEGRNAQATMVEIYFHDPFLAFAYVASIPFFIGLHQAFGLAGLAGRGMLAWSTAAGPLRTIRYCALAMLGFVAVGEGVILLTESDDRAGGVAVGLAIALGASLVAAAAAGIERALRKRAPAQ